MTQPKKFARSKPFDPARCVMAPLAVELRQQTERVIEWQSKLARAKTAARKQVVGAELRAARLAKWHAERAFFAGTHGFRWKMIRRYQGDDVDDDDLDNVARIACWKAALSWQPERGSPFDTWARRAMRWELSRVILKARIVKGSDKGDCVSLSDDRELRKEGVQ